MKRLICALAALCLLLGGCGANAQPEQKKYTATFLDVFDTVTTIVGYSDSQEAFSQTAQAIHDELLGYHQLFDIYNDYDGLVNLKTVNDNAGIAPVVVDEKILDLVEDCKAYAELTGGRVNAAMGSVLTLWHQAREDGLEDPANAYLPGDEALAEAARHMDIRLVEVDRTASTVYLPEGQMRLDVGAIAKGWATQRAADNAPQGLLISVGGNVCATGPKQDGDGTWVIGVENPDGGDYLNTIAIAQGSVVTSGDYQRTYWVAGQAYHHIIDPETLYPGQYWRAVTVICSDSGLADALSTALFLLPLEEGKQLLESTGSQAMWVGLDGTIHYSDGFQDMILT